jgi:hypothetical protein
VSLKEALRVQQSPTQLFSEPEEKEEEAEVNPRLEGTQYPIDIASPILLATSMILAIFATGMLLLYVVCKREFLCMLKGVNIHCRCCSCWSDTTP